MIAMREVEVRIKGSNIADVMGELRKWLDHHDCTPENFDIQVASDRSVVVRIEFTDDRMAEAFDRDFRS